MENQLNPGWVQTRFHPVFLQICKMNPGTPFPIPCGDNEFHEYPNIELVSNYPIMYTQGSKSYCFAYSIGSAFKFLGYREAAYEIVQKPTRYKNLPITESMNYVSNIMTQKYKFTVMKYNFKRQRKKWIH